MQEEDVVLGELFIFHGDGCVLFVFCVCLFCFKKLFLLHVVKVVRGTKRSTSTIVIAVASTSTYSRESRHICIQSSS